MLLVSVLLVSVLLVGVLLVSVLLVNVLLGWRVWVLSRRRSRAPGVERWGRGESMMARTRRRPLGGN